MARELATLNQSALRDVENLSLIAQNVRDASAAAREEAREADEYISPS
jgi:hypothetical protein